MNISELAFKYKKLFLFIVVCLMIYGGLSYFTLPSQEDPTIVNREAIVSTNFPGIRRADPENPRDKKTDINFSNRVIYYPCQNRRQIFQLGRYLAKFKK